MGTSHNGGNGGRRGTAPFGVDRRALEATITPDSLGGVVRIVSHTETESLIGTVLDGYRIVRYVAAGGMAFVFQAEHVSNRAPCAVKVLKPELWEEMGPRFLREATIVMKLKHHGIASVFGCGKLEVAGRQSAYLLMEFLDGHTLREALDAADPVLPSERAARIAHQIAEALDEAHSAGVLHRDLKPTNFFLTTDRRGRERVKVLDFGVAKQVNMAGGPDLTRAGMAMGTPDYMSPEQVNGAPMDTRTDIFSLGTVLYEMLTGTRPFQKDTPLGTMYAVAHETHRPVREAWSEVPEGLASLVEQMLNKNPDERPASMETVMERLAPFAGALTTPSTPSATLSVPAVPVISSASTPATPPPERRRSLLLYGAVALAALLTAGLIAWGLVRGAGERAAVRAARGAQPATVSRGAGADAGGAQRTASPLPATAAASSSPPPSASHPRAKKPQHAASPLRPAPPPKAKPLVRADETDELLKRVTDYKAALRRNPRSTELPAQLHKACAKLETFGQHPSECQ